MLDINERLARLGLSAADAQDGLIQAKVQVASLEELRHLLDTGADDVQRQKLHTRLIEGIEAQDDGLVERVYEYVFGNGALSEADREAVAPMFPLTLYVTAAPGPKTISGKWDLSTPDGQMQVVLLTDFTMDDSGYVVCYKTPLQFTCDTLTRNGKPAVAGDFNILGATGADIPADGPPPTPGRAQSGPPGECPSTGGGNGHPGATGTTGAPGGRGNDGIASQLAHITVNKGVTTTGRQIVIATRSGTGGTGQPGGRGGTGGQGGNGGDGKICGLAGTSGGSGGIGGRGGDGGPGGPGGNAVNASANVVVAAPVAEHAKFLQGGLTQVVPPGTGGTGGGPGSGGPGGSGGKGKKDGANGPSAGGGGPGTTGPQGPRGTESGKPANVQLEPL